MKIDIDQTDFGTLCICALRYCQGRRTYMPSMVQEIVGQHLTELADRDIRVMAEDCEYQASMDLYGDECDKVDWLKWEAKVRAEHNKRITKEEQK